jgi:hypothetical protein
MTKRSITGIGAAALIVILALALLIQRGKSPAGPERVAESPPAPEIQTLQADLSPAITPTAAEAPEDELAEMEPEGINYNEHGMNPEDQPRQFFVQHFRPGELPPGYTLHNVRLTERGFELEGGGRAGEPRIGMIESPPLPLDFPSNAVAPSWIDDLPEGTSVLIEISVSPDGENWGMWHAADVDHDSFGQVSPTYPDGSPNPNYGYTPGGLFIWGNLLWTHWRYTIALYSDSQESPSVSSLRMFYQDSTMGEGRPAELNITAPIAEFPTP